MEILVLPDRCSDRDGHGRSVQYGVPAVRARLELAYCVFRAHDGAFYRIYSKGLLSEYQIMQNATKSHTLAGCGASNNRRLCFSYCMSLFEHVSCLSLSFVLAGSTAGISCSRLSDSFEPMHSRTNSLGRNNLCPLVKLLH